MPHSIFGEVVGVRKYTNGDLEIDFYHEDQITEYRYSSDLGRLGNFPKDLIESRLIHWLLTYASRFSLKKTALLLILNWKNVMMILKMMKNLTRTLSQRNHELCMYFKAQGVPKISLIFTQLTNVIECPRHNIIRQNNT